MPTIGVAVAIPEPWARDLQQYRMSVGDLTATQIPTHITLIPPVEVDAEDLEAIEEHLRGSAGSMAPFQVHLRGTGSFRPISPVVFVTLAEGISACEQLADVIRRGPLDLELQFPFHPHVTVAHHLPDDVLDRAFDDLADFECRFVADSFHLYLHDADAGWRPSREFRLVGTA